MRNCPSFRNPIGDPVRKFRKLVAGRCYRRLPNNGWFVEFVVHSLRKTKFSFGGRFRAFERQFHVEALSLVFHSSIIKKLVWQFNSYTHFVSQKFYCRSIASAVAIHLPHLPRP